MKCLSKVILGRILLTLATLVVSSTGVFSADWKLTSPKGEVTVLEPRYAEYVLWQVKNPTTPLTFALWSDPVREMPSKPIETKAEVPHYNLVNGQYIPLNDAARAMPVFGTPVRTALNNTFNTLQNVFQASPCANGRCPK